MDKEIVTVKDSVVACAGPAMGHPRVFLTFKAGGTETVCPYCGRVFVREGGEASPSVH